MNTSEQIMAKAVELLFSQSGEQFSMFVAKSKGCRSSLLRQICLVNKTENTQVHKSTIKVAKNGF